MNGLGVSMYPLNPVPRGIVWENVADIEYDGCGCENYQFYTGKSPQPLIVHFFSLHNE